MVRGDPAIRGRGERGRRDRGGGRGGLPNMKPCVPPVCLRWRNSFVRVGLLPSVAVHHLNCPRLLFFKAAGDACYPKTPGVASERAIGLPSTKVASVVHTRKKWRWIPHPLEYTSRTSRRRIQKTVPGIAQAISGIRNLTVGGGGGCAQTN